MCIRDSYYSVGGNNLMLAIKNAEESEPVNHNAIAQCKILLAEHMYEATMLWLSLIHI